MTIKCISQGSPIVARWSNVGLQFIACPSYWQCSLALTQNNDILQLSWYCYKILETSKVSEHSRAWTTMDVLVRPSKKYGLAVLFRSFNGSTMLVFIRRIYYPLPYRGRCNFVCWCRCHRLRWVPSSGTMQQLFPSPARCPGPAPSRGWWHQVIIPWHKIKGIPSELGVSVRWPLTGDWSHTFWPGWRFCIVEPQNKDFFLRLMWLGF